MSVGVEVEEEEGAVAAGAVAAVAAGAAAAGWRDGGRGHWRGFRRENIPQTSSF